MYTFFIILILLVVVGIGIGLFSKRSGGGKTGEEKILDFIHRNGTVTSKDVQDMLEVSDSVAEEYLQKLGDRKEIIKKETTEPYKIYEARRR